MLKASLQNVDVMMVSKMREGWQPKRFWSMDANQWSLYGIWDAKS